MYIWLLNSCVKFHAKISTHCWNINKSRRGILFYVHPVYALWYCYGNTFLNAINSFSLTLSTLLSSCQLHISQQLSSFNDDYRRYHCNCSHPDDITSRWWQLQSPRSTTSLVIITIIIIIIIITVHSPCHEWHVSSSHRLHLKLHSNTQRLTLRSTTIIMTVTAATHTHTQTHRETAN